MSVRSRYQLECDRCHDPIGEPTETDLNTGRESSESLIMIEAPAFGVGMTSFRDLCDPCKKTLPRILVELVHGSKNEDGEA